MKSRNLWSLGILATGLTLILGCATGVTATVKAKFAADDLVKASQIEVETKDGVVTLTGNVDSEDAKNRAVQIARDTAGVTKVIDMMAARTAAGSGNAPDPDRSVGTVLDDAGITMSVKGRLLDDPMVQGLKIDVDTREGIVYLTGSVGSDAEKQQAIQLAKDAKGVKDVKANLTIEKT